MKIGVIVESFREPLYTAFESAARIGAQGVQMYAVCKDHNLITMTGEERAALKKRLDELGLKVSAICGDLGGHGFQDAAGNPERIRLSKQIIDICADFDTHVMTTHIGVVPTREESPVYQTMLEAAREVAQYAAAHGVTLAIETGPEPADRLKNLLKMPVEKALV